LRSSSPSLEHVTDVKLGRLRAKLASQNENKLRELRHAMPGWELELLDAHDYPPRTARRTTRTRSARRATGSSRPGRGCSARTPGSRCARSAAVPESSPRAGRTTASPRCSRRSTGVDEREARYVCELVALSPDGEELRGTGTVEGTIASEPRGSEGFGYDPIFVPVGETRTVAELGNDWKREHSHRALAARALAPS
jgi:inosine/xanthosine triphosphate pyrophosphatase family protein